MQTPRIPFAHFAVQIVRLAQVLLTLNVQLAPSTDIPLQALKIPASLQISALLRHSQIPKLSNARLATNRVFLAKEPWPLNA